MDLKMKKVSKKQDGGLKDWIPKYERTMFEQINPRKSLLSGFYHIRTINNKSNIEREKIFQKIFIDILMKKSAFQNPIKSYFGRNGLRLRFNFQF